MGDAPQEPVITDDSTPLAQGGHVDRQAVKRIRRWVYTAGTERLNHLALMQRSPASRAFARRHMLMLATAAALVQFCESGWHHVVRTPDNAGLISTTPTGSFWVRLASSELSPRTYGFIALWWNPILSGLGVLIGGCTGVLAVWLMYLVMNAGAGVILGSPYREQERLRGAIHYGFAFAAPIYGACWIALLGPARNWMAASGWRIVPPGAVVSGLAVVVAGIAAVLWWFWLIRLSMTLPADARIRVAMYYAVAVPIATAAIVAAWWRGMSEFEKISGSLLDLGWAAAP